VPGLGHVIRDQRRQQGVDRTESGQRDGVLDDHGQMSQVAEDGDEAELELRQAGRDGAPGTDAQD